MTLTSKVLKGSFWTSLSTVITTSINFLVTIILARILEPKDFGLFAMVFMVTSFVGVFSDFGFGAAIIQRRDVSNSQLSTFFIVNILIGFSISLTLFLFAPIISFFFEEPQIKPLIQLSGITFLLGPLGTVHSLLFQKRLNFKVPALIEVVSTFMYGLSTTIFAHFGLKVWSFLWGSIIQQVTFLILLWIFSAWRPIIKECKLSSIKGLVKFSFNYTGASLLTYFNRNIDNLLIGKLLGSTPLAIYSLAYRIMMFPLAKISYVIARVSFPTFSLVQDDNDKIIRGYLKQIKIIALVTFPLMTLVFLLAPEIIILFFGDKWKDTILILKVFAFIGMIQSVSTMVGTIYNAKGRTDIAFKWSILVGITLFFSILLGINWGINGVAYAYAISSTILSFSSQLIANQIIGLKLSLLLRQLRVPVISSILMFILGGIVKNNLLTITNDRFLIVFIMSLITVVIHLSLIYLLDKPLLKEFKNIYVSFKQKRL